MRCRYCGQRIPEGELYCRHCGKEVRIVPDYNPLDDMLTAQIKGAIDDDEDIYNDSYTTRSTRNRNNRNAGRTAGAAGNASTSTTRAVSTKARTDVLTIHIHIRHGARPVIEYHHVHVHCLRSTSRNQQHGQNDRQPLTHLLSQ